MRIIKGIYIVFALVAVAGCSSDPDLQLSGEERSAVDTERDFNQYANDLQTIVQAAMDEANDNVGGRTANSALLECAEVTISGTKESGMIRVDYGEGCEGPFGHIRKGVIEIEYNGNYLLKGSSYYLETVDFYIDNVKVEGSRTATNISETLLEPKFRIVTTEGKITWPDGTFMTREEEREHTLRIDLSDPSFTLEIEGSASGITRMGESYQSTIQNELVYESECLANAQYVPSRGDILIERPEKPDISVGFGEGECDGKVSVVVGIVVIELEI